LEKRILARPKEYAERLNVSVGTVYNKVSRGEFLPGLVKIPKQGGRALVRFDLEALDRWIDRQIAKEG
jgi:excisionase family DNA binding protein